MTQVIGNLPTDGVRALHHFLIVGVDICGHVNITLKTRGRPPNKMYIAAFVCFTSKAVHLELVSGLFSDVFFVSFKRFVVRCGYPRFDSETKFVGASRDLNELQKRFLVSQDTVGEYGASQIVQFSFILSRGPHFRGLWEVTVKQAKLLLLRAFS